MSKAAYLSYPMPYLEVPHVMSINLTQFFGDLLRSGAKPIALTIKSIMHRIMDTRGLIALSYLPSVSMALLLYLGHDSTL